MERRSTLHASTASAAVARRVFIGPTLAVARGQTSPDFMKMPVQTSHLARNFPAGLLDRVLYRDGLILVIDKPAGIAVHQGPGGGPHLEHWFPLLRFGLPRPPALAHRLDRDTSGCLVLGRHPKALRRLGRLFAEGKVEKVYWAIVHGAPTEREG